jgi:ABC-type nitrate/sulfonate/bicarbonate transport system substrate-binding protein
MGKQLQRKRSTVVVLCTLCWFWLVGCVPIQPTGQPQNRADAAVTPLRVCYSSNSATQSVMLYAYEQGIFQEYGLAVELIYIEGGSTATAALIAGAVDVCQIAGASVINGVVAGADLALIAGLFTT